MGCIMPQAKPPSGHREKTMFSLLRAAPDKPLRW